MTKVVISDSDAFMVKKQTNKQTNKTEQWFTTDYKIISVNTNNFKFSWALFYGKGQSC